MTDDDLRNVGVDCLRWVLDGLDYTVMDVETYNGSEYMATARIGFSVEGYVGYSGAKESMFVAAFDRSADSRFKFYVYTYFGDELFAIVYDRLHSLKSRFEREFSGFDELRLELDLAGI
jgi:hypothetical protein